MHYICPQSLLAQSRRLYECKPAVSHDSVLLRINKPDSRQYPRPESWGRLGRIAARRRQRSGLGRLSRHASAVHLEHLGGVLQLPRQLLEALSDICQRLQRQSDPLNSFLTAQRSCCVSRHQRTFCIWSMMRVLPTDLISK